MGRHPISARDKVIKYLSVKNRGGRVCNLHFEDDTLLTLWNFKKPDGTQRVLWEPRTGKIIEDGRYDECKTYSSAFNEKFPIDFPVPFVTHHQADFEHQESRDPSEFLPYVNAETYHIAEMEGERIESANIITGHGNFFQFEFKHEKTLTIWSFERPENLQIVFWRLDPSKIITDMRSYDCKQYSDMVRRKLGARTPPWKFNAPFRVEIENWPVPD